MKKLLLLFLILWAGTASAVELQTIRLKLTLWEKITTCTWHISCYQQKFGTSISTITGTETVSYALKTTVNNNFTALNAGKIENATTSVASITILGGLTSASSLATVGTLTSGALGTGFTLVPVSVGGTASSSLASSSVMLGAGVSGFKTVVGLGTVGQFLTSCGALCPPYWSTSAVDQGINYHWTANHIFDSANFTIASSTNATSTNLTITGHTIANTITASGAVKSNSRTLPEILLQDNDSYTTTQTSTTSVLTYKLLANTMGANSTLDIYGACSRTGSTNGIYGCVIKLGTGTGTTTIAYVKVDMAALPLSFGDLRVKIINANSLTAQRITYLPMDNYTASLGKASAGSTGNGYATTTVYNTGADLYISFEGIASTNAAGFQGITITKY